MLSSQRLTDADCIRSMSVHVFMFILKLICNVYIDTVYCLVYFMCSAFSVIVTFV